MPHTQLSPETKEALNAIREDLHEIKVALKGTYATPGLSERVRRLETLAGWLLAGVGTCAVAVGAWLWSFLTNGPTTPHS